MITVTLGDLADVVHVGARADDTGPARSLIVLTDAQGNTAEVTVSGYAAAARLREAAARSVAWHREQTEHAYAADE